MTSPSDGRIVTIEGIDVLIRHLRDEGHVVIGPTVRDGVITIDELTAAADLPRGWTEEEAPGSYRLEPGAPDHVFGFSTPSDSWKRFVHPPRELLVRSHRVDGHIMIDEPEPSPRQVALFGMRPCDVAGLERLDRVLADPDATDPQYVARRRNTIVVAAACASPSSTCFCSSMGTGPAPMGVFDLAIAELTDGETVDYLIRAGTPVGERLLNLLPGRASTEDDLRRAEVHTDAAVAAMTRSIDPRDPPLAALDPDHLRWNDVAQRCLACGNCTMVCPTCFCSTTADSTSLDGSTADRSRVWDSCFTLQFTQLHGGSVRTSISSRYRQWLLHKLVTWHDQFGSSGCVGCGRCITWCPVGIDLTVEIAELARHQEATT